MSDTLSVSLDTSKDVVQPSLEEEAAKYDSIDTADPVEERPEWLPDKFKTSEDMAKAYSELEKKLGSKAPPEPPQVPVPPTGDNADTMAAKEVAGKAGIDFDTLSNKYRDNGVLEDADYADLEGKGIPKSMVDSYIAGQEAILNEKRNTVFNAVGGEQEYDAMTAWATGSMDSSEIQAYNIAVDSGNMSAAMMAVKGLKARYQAAEGFEPTREVQGSTSKADPGSYRSIAEMQKDMLDPRYRLDAAFRKDVERKIDRSNIF